MSRGSAYAAGAMVMVGSSIAVSGVLCELPVFLGQVVRYTLAAAVLHAALATQRRHGAPRAPIGPRQWMRIVAIAACGMVGFSVVVVAAERHSSPAFVGVVVGCAPVVIALLNPVLQRSSPSRRLLLAAIVVAAGAGLTQGFGGSTDTAGTVLSVAAMSGEVAFALIAAPVLGQLGALRVSAHACTVAIPIAVTGMIVTGGYAWPTAAQLAALAWLGIAVTGVGYLLWFTAVRAVGPDRAGLFTALVPVSAVATTALLGVDRPSGPEVAGALVVLAGLVLGSAARAPRPGHAVAGADRAAPTSHPVLTPRGTDRTYA